MAADADALTRWARGFRSGGRGGGAPAAAPPPPAAPANPTHQLPPPPPGFAYQWHPQVGTFVLIALPPQAPPQPAYQPPPLYAPPPVSHQAPPPPRGQVLSFPVKTCTLVRPGNVDTYAELLAQTPDLPGVPNYAQGDAMAGYVSDETRRALAEASPGMGEPLMYVDAPNAYQGNIQPIKSGAPLAAPAPAGSDPSAA